MQRFAGFFLVSKYVSKAEDAASLLSSLSLLTTNNRGIPVVIAVDGKSIRVTNVLDKSIGRAKVTLAKVEAVYGGPAAGQGSTLSSTDNIGYSLAPVSAPGVYRLRVTVEPQTE